MARLRRESSSKANYQASPDFTREVQSGGSEVPDSEIETSSDVLEDRGRRGRREAGANFGRREPV